MKKRFSQNQMILPLLQSLRESGGKARTADLCNAVADKLNVPQTVRQETVKIAGEDVNLFSRTVRWSQQTSKVLSLVEPAGRPYWRLTGKGEEALKEALPGVVVTIFHTPKGVALFASCEDAVGFLEDESTILSSPLLLTRSLSRVHMGIQTHVNMKIGTSGARRSGPAKWRRTAR